MESDLLLKPITSRRKVESAQESLTKLALRAGANAKLPTVREICRQLGITAVTAGHVLAGLEEQGVITRRQGSGIYVSPRLYQKSIGLVFGSDIFDSAGAFWGLLVRQCQRRAQDGNERFSFYVDIPQVDKHSRWPVPEELVEALSKKRLDGLLLAKRRSVAQEAWLRRQGVPVVSFAGGLNSRLAASVGFDLRGLVHSGVEALAKRGCRRLALISPWAAATAVFPRVMRAVNLPYSRARVIHCQDIAGETREQFGYRAMQNMLRSAEGGKPDGILVCDDALTVGVVAAIEQTGVDVGRDVLVATHANRGSTVLQLLERRLILLEVDPEAVVDAMFAMIEKMWGASEGGDPAGVVVPVRARAGKDVGVCTTSRSEAASHESI